jgi:hypothetical protein
VNEFRRERSLDTPPQNDPDDDMQRLRDEYGS